MMIALSRGAPVPPTAPSATPLGKEAQCVFIARHLVLQETNGRTMITPWTKDVDRDAPHPEYPRPQMQRRSWQNLNGQWEFDCTSLTGTLPNLNETLKRKITVPFPVESYLSGTTLDAHPVSSLLNPNPKP